MRTSMYVNSVFEQPWWLDVVAPNAWKEILVKDKDGKVIARQAIVFDKKNIFIPKLTQTLGIWMDDSVSNDYGTMKKICKELCQQLSEYKNVVVHLTPNNKYVLPFIWEGYQISPRFTYRILDLSDTEGLYQGFNNTAKKNIKSAKNKVMISDKMDVDELWSMIIKTYKIQNRKPPISKELIERMVYECEAHNCGKYLCAKDKEGNVHSCAYFVYDENVCYYLLGATDSQYRSSGAQSLVIWEGIQFAAKHSKIFDFEGSMVEGIENFFRQFNNECVAYYEIRKQSFYKELFRLVKPRIKRIIGYK